MMNLKNKKGLTLVSLMVTVIVVLILLGIAAEYSRDGVLSKAEGTYQKNKMAEDKEDVERAVAKIMETKSIVTNSDVCTKLGWSLDGTYIKSPNGNKFNVNEFGEITVEN